ncbi:MAG: S8 family serine peptidase [Clostridia bacterium]
MKIVHLAIIDDGVSPMRIKVKTQCYEVVDTKCMKMEEPTYCINHATRIASVITDYQGSNIDLVSIKILDNASSYGNIAYLVIALEWCIAHDIDVINLSVGSIHFADRSILSPIMKRVYEKGIVVVAAYSNNGALTYPASLPYAIGVCRDLNKVLAPSDHIYYRDPLDGVDIVSGCRTSFLETYDIECNSYATAEVTGKVCRYIAQTKDSTQDSVREYLRLSSINRCLNIRTFDFAISNNIDQPVIIVNCSDEMAEEYMILCLIDEFLASGYNCVGLIGKTEIHKNLFGIKFLVDHYGLSESIIFLNTFISPDIYMVGASAYATQHDRCQDLDLIKRGEMLEVIGSAVDRTILWNSENMIEELISLLISAFA